MTVNLKPYLERIRSDEDKLLFDDAVKAAECGALRAAYIMIWLSCAESLKRRFREALTRDSQAGAIVAEIRKKEESHHAIDGYVVDQAKIYGFLSDSAHQILRHIYDMRCIYGHPYEKAPSEEQVVHGASSVVEHLLSRPVTLKHGFCNQLLHDLTTDAVYLDDYKEAVQEFASDVLVKIDGTVYPWLFEEYAKKLDALDPTLKVFTRRGRWFLQQMVKVGGTELFDSDEWLRVVSTYKTSSVQVFHTAEAFRELGPRAQDCLVGIIIEKSVKNPNLLQVLDSLDLTKCLTLRQSERFKERIEQGPPFVGQSASWLRATGLRLPLCFPKIIELLKSHNYHTQNPAAELVAEKGAESVAELSEADQEILGRNILQSADGGAYSSIELIEEAGRTAWPEAFVKGLVFECLINELGQFRIKHRCFDKVMAAMVLLPEADRLRVLDDLAETIDAGKAKSWIDEQEIDAVVSVLTPYEFATPFKDRFTVCATKLMNQFRANFLAEHSGK